jgi:hypothetical protein
MENKRINLSFHLAREEDRVVYNLIQSSRGKTKYVIDAVMAFGDKNEGIDKENLKEAVKEALLEIGLDTKVQEKEQNSEDKQEIEQNQIPDDLFNMISGL